MRNFTWDNPTVIYFGRDQISRLSKLKESGDKVLLVYGGGSIKKTGIYDSAMEVLDQAGLSVAELSGVEPNPRIESVRKGVEICRAENIDMVLAIGGGSVIDAAKIIAAGALYDGDPWDLVVNGRNMKRALPVYTVLTVAATGSEMDMFAVISDMSSNEKRGTGSRAIQPKMSILDPEYTFTVSPRQTAAGVADIMSHTLENYFTPVKSAGLQRNICEAILRTVVQYGPVAYKEADNYEARANLMWSSSLAINGLVSQGAAVAWSVHPIEHELSAFYDVTHGEGLAILTPAWMEKCMKKAPETTEDLARFGRNVFGLTEQDPAKAAAEAVAALRRFLFEDMHIPSALSMIGINDRDNFDIMAEKAAKQCRQCYVPLDKTDVLEILEAVR